MIYNIGLTYDIKALVNSQLMDGTQSTKNHPNHSKIESQRKILCNK